MRRETEITQTRTNGNIIREDTFLNKLKNDKLKKLKTTDAKCGFCRCFKINKCLLTNKFLKPYNICHNYVSKDT